jgi:DNA repair exonuclease SbcCD nuclease subunit
MRKNQTPSTAPTLMKVGNMPRSIAVLISDIHYNLQTLKLADAAMRQAIQKANELNVPLVVAGDLHDTKANLRGECINQMIETFKLCDKKPYVLVGNHDRINEKSAEHSLNFLSPYCNIIDSIFNVCKLPSIHLVPYSHDNTGLATYVSKLPKDSTIIMHQGLMGSNTGEYFQDKSALSPGDLPGLRVISGHYHARQTINLPEGGKFDYIGNPYTLSYGEASDMTKGFQILMNDGSLEFVPTNLRKHVKVELGVDAKGLYDGHRLCHADPEDLVWVTVAGPREYLSSITKEMVRKYLGLKQDIRFDLTPTDPETQLPTKQLAGGDLMDTLIDGLTNTSDERKLRLKELWRHLGS